MSSSSSTTMRYALAAASLAVQFTISFAQIIPTPTVTPAMNALTAVGCFSTAAPMIDHGPYNFQSKGNCQPICYGLNMPVMGLVNGTNCFCGSLIPPNSTQVDNGKCNTPCGGINTEMCGGANFWSVYLTGITRNHIENLDSASLSTTAATTSKTATASVGPQTVVVTQSAEAKASGGSNTVGIAVGVVVGVIGLLGALLGAWLFMRHKRRREVEEEYKRNAAVQSFTHSGKTRHGSNDSVGDQRLDPELLAARRASNGSINDTADYSRRILQVRNPDGGY